MYDLLIVGAGPAGLTAAIYAARYKLKTLVIGEESGGTASEAFKICNFPSYQAIKGEDLVTKIEEHAKALGVEIKNDTVEDIRFEGTFKVKAFFGEYEAKKIVLATGTTKRKLGLNEDDYEGKGVSYCATCDAGFYEDQEVVVLGGGNAALTSALLLSEYASKVYLVYRRDKFYRASPMWVDQVEKNDKIELEFNTTVSELKGEKGLEKIVLSNGKTLAVQGLFIVIGQLPNSALAEKMGVKTDKKGYVVTDDEQRTNVNGVFAAGDVTNNNFKQVITACSEGAISASKVYEDLIK